jgi:hypothetical protein
VRFGKEAPFHADLRGYVYRLRLDSAGSLLVMQGEKVRELCWPQEDVVVGLCRQIYEFGGSVWLDPAQRVIHP